MTQRIEGNTTNYMNDAVTKYYHLTDQCVAMRQDRAVLPRSSFELVVEG